MGTHACSPYCLRSGFDPAQITAPPDSAAPGAAPLAYCVDPSDRVCAVNQVWRDFAHRNGGGAKLGEHIVGSDLWASISDPHVCEIYRQLTLRARAGRPVRFRYRCDAPAQRRTFEMQIEGTTCGGVRFTSRLLRAEDRPPVHLLESGGARSDAFLRVCAWCQRVAVAEEEWLEVEEAVNRLELLDTDLPPRLTHGMCPACEVTFLQSASA